MLHVTDLSIAIGEGAPVVDGLSFSIAPGETVGLVGASGAGKSLSAAALLGLLPAGARVRGGRAIFRRKSGESVDLLALRARQYTALRGREMGLVFQETQAALNPVLSCGSQMREAVRRLRPDMPDPKSYVSELLERVELAPLGDRIMRALPNELSGGELQRLLIGMALIGEPRLLIADEPTTALDSITETEMVRLLDRLRRELGMGMLFITHDARLLTRIADRVVPIGPPPTTTVESMDRPLARSTPARVLVDVRELTVTYPGREQPAVSRCSFRIAEGEWLALIGPSGCGKTTLAHWMVGLRPALSGSLQVEGLAQPATLTGRTIRTMTGAQIIFQDVNGSLNPGMSVGATLREVTKLHGSGDAAAFLRRVNLAPERFLERYPHQLSGGERQRVVIARALAAKPRILICDEAVASLDLPLREEIQALLKQIGLRDRIGILFITHDLHQVVRFADRVLLMNQGRIVEQGSATDILRAPATDVGKRLVAAARLDDEDGGEPKLARPAL
nr:ATP-binding cassette domain-containing protein [Lewinella sp. JB7]